MFKPNFKITPKIQNALIQIETTRQVIDLLPISPKIIANLRKTAKLMTTHYSTEIEGNRLNLREVKKVVEGGSIKSKKRDEREVLGYYEALNEVEYIINNNLIITEEIIKKLHSLIINGGNKRRKPTEYRDGQNVIKDSLTGRIVYMPPEAKDVPTLMNKLVSWILNNMNNKNLPCPVIASIVHYQIATVHPYYDGNGRLARILTTLILHLGGYSLKGIYSLEEYYSENINSYYSSISIGESHNYYMGRAEADITKWVEYFCEGMSVALEKVKKNIQNSSRKYFQENSLEKHTDQNNRTINTNAVNKYNNIDNFNNNKTKSPLRDKSYLLRELDHKQRKVLELFEDNKEITAKDIEKVFPLKPRTIRKLCQKWYTDGFFEISDNSKKGRKYILNEKWERILNN